jgi:hypothetical protein
VVRMNNTSRCRIERARNAIVLGYAVRHTKRLDRRVRERRPRRLAPGHATIVHLDGANQHPMSRARYMTSHFWRRNAAGLLRRQDIRPDHGWWFDHRAELGHLHQPLTNRAEAGGVTPSSPQLLTSSMIRKLAPDLTTCRARGRSMNPKCIMGDSVRALSVGAMG